MEIEADSYHLELAVSHFAGPSRVFPFHVSLKRIFATTTNMAQLTDVFFLLVHLFFVTLSVTFAGEVLRALVAFPAFLPFPPLLLPPQSRNSVTCGRCGGFKLHLVGSHRETHITGKPLTFPIRLPICGATFARRFTV